MAKKTSKPRAAKSKSKTVSSPIEKVYSETGIPDSNESGEWLSDYCHEAATGFMEEWKKDNEVEEAPEEVYTAVLEAIETKAGKDLWEHQRGWLLEAIESAAQEASRAARAPQAIDSPDEEKGIVSITIHEPFLKIWRDEVEGMGYSAWGGDESLTDIDSLVMVLNILDNMSEVYGFKPIKRQYDAAVDDRFEPEAGRYGELTKIAEAAYKKIKG